MPVFTWMGLVTQFLMAFAMPVITIALFLRLLFDRLYDATFFDMRGRRRPVAVGAPVPRIFGREVYILILPAFGIISEIIPVFGHRPCSATRSWCSRASPSASWDGACGPAYSPLASARSRWRHTSVSTMFIAVPTGVKIFNWMATLWGGKLQFDGHEVAVGMVATSPSAACRASPTPSRSDHPADRHLLHRRPFPT